MDTPDMTTQGRTRIATLEPTPSPEALPGPSPERVAPEVAEALGAFFTRVAPQMQQTAYGILRHWQQAEDAVSETLRKALPHWAAIEESAQASAEATGEEERAEVVRKRYVFRLLTNTCIDELRRRKHTPHAAYSLDYRTELENGRETGELAEILLECEALLTSPSMMLDALCARETLAEVREAVLTHQQHGERAWATALLVAAGFTIEEVSAFLADSEHAGTRGALKTALYRVHCIAREVLPEGERI